MKEILLGRGPHVALVDGCGHREVAWEAAINEDGWVCMDCDQRLGFRPDLDAECAEEKVDAILTVLHEHGLVHVSNGTQGEVIAHNTAVAARTVGRFDQHTLVGLILSDPNVASHAVYWAAAARRWLEAEDRGEGHETPVDQQLRGAGVPTLPGLA